MRRSLAIVVACGFLAGCSTSPNTSMPLTGATLPRPRANRGAVNAPLSVTVNPPRAPVASPGASAPSGWKTFVSNSLGVAIDYPGDWTLSEQADGVTFTSPQGEAVQLNPAQPGSSSGQCSILTNSRGVSINACFDSNTEVYSAQLAGSDGTSPHGLMLSTSSKEALDIYRQMLDSVRLIQ